jgi:hypothetical protein
MTDPDSREGTGAPANPDRERESLEGERMTSLLRDVMSDEAILRRADNRLLAGVQRKIRQRSRGKFYGDGWSTSHARMNYVFVAMVMLVLLGIAYFALAPIGIAPR